MVFLLRGALGGAAIGAVVLGVTSRLFMRLLTFYDGRQPGFSLGGSAEILAYGAIVGAVSGVIIAMTFRSGLARSRLRGFGWGLAIYAVTVLTLPAHIAQTAAPFAAIMPFVHAGFLVIFLLFGYFLIRFISNADVHARG